MARVSITRQFPDGDVVVVTVKVDGSAYPDELRQATMEALHGYAEVMGMTLLAPEGDE